MSPALAATQRVWLVWSNEHTAWWRPNSAGYTMDIRQAGRYTESEARDCCRSGKLHPDGKPEEIMVMAPEAVEAAVNSLPDDPAALRAEIVRLRNRYEMPGQRCNGGHVNHLPVSAWDCPIHVEEMREHLKTFEREFEGLAAINCSCVEDAADDESFTCPDDGQACECFTCSARKIIAEYRRNTGRST